MDDRPTGAPPLDSLFFDVKTGQCVGCRDRDARIAEVEGERDAARAELGLDE